MRACFPRSRLRRDRSPAGRPLRPPRRTPAGRCDTLSGNRGASQTWAGRPVGPRSLMSLAAAAPSAVQCAADLPAHAWAGNSLPFVRCAEEPSLPAVPCGASGPTRACECGKLGHVTRPAHTRVSRHRGNLVVAAEWSVQMAEECRRLAAADRAIGAAGVLSCSRYLQHRGDVVPIRW
jgi:hypothetical protein